MIAGIVTGLLLVLFVGGWIWAWSPKRKQAFDEAAQLPLLDGDVAAHDRIEDKGNVA
ncbi:MAG: cbb3-type cytochrome c oxidase subunit 3 [Xanthomonadales bacterium]|nr:cbb3-type cytochrome c oxidase subunit 3 [Xanthomonadaceae bacterium]MBN8224476.1 cbb3-type cytochrome c oxidase subunit 3 [Xanthomonadales bacterium]MCA0197058.1 cbb3-type cytochrome c oxidase subunit 3 [Pseudomonadota bacterium]HRF83328.1 cbb3-type cytochrome c oxidase subunit 3 [Pseudoxanthomonas sp.]